MGLTVLDRKLAVLGCLYQTESWCQNYNQLDLQPTIDRRPQLLSFAPFLKSHCQSNSNFQKPNNSCYPPKKRKPELQLEAEDDIKGKSTTEEEEESGEEKSEITSKTGEVRREKINKKMKCLQYLVLGCNKVTDKARMLDEINYVQSLQKQMEQLQQVSNWESDWPSRFN